MFDIGFTELLLVGVVALIVLGPERLPHAARMAGAWVGKIRRSFTALQVEIEREVNASEMKERIRKEAEKVGLKDIESELNDAVAQIQNPTPHHQEQTELSSAATQSSVATESSPQKPMSEFENLSNSNSPNTITNQTSTNKTSPK